MVRAAPDCAIGQSMPAQDAGTAQAPSEEGDASDAAIATAPGQCEVAACARDYNSFRASDCTYQPYGGGPRQRCDRPFAPTPPPAREPDEAQEMPLPDD